MPNTAKIIEKAKDSGFYRWLLNKALWKRIPFNSPHRIKVIEITDDSITTWLPYRKRNLNHIKGLHACALATLCEFTTGFQLLRKLDLTKYRIIMKELKMEYYYQGKSGAVAKYPVDQQWIDSKIIEPLQHDDSVITECKIECHDRQNNHLATGTVYWQFKRWEKVKTKV